MYFVGKLKSNLIESVCNQSDGIVQNMELLNSRTSDRDVRIFKRQQRRLRNF